VSSKNNNEKEIAVYKEFLYEEFNEDFYDPTRTDRTRSNFLANNAVIDTVIVWPWDWIAFKFQSIRGKSHFNEIEAVNLLFASVTT